MLCRVGVKLYSVTIDYSAFEIQKFLLKNFWNTDEFALIAIDNEPL